MAQAAPRWSDTTDRMNAATSSERSGFGTRVKLTASGRCGGVESWLDAQPPSGETASVDARSPWDFDHRSHDRWLTPSSSIRAWRTSTTCSSPSAEISTSTWPSPTSSVAALCSMWDVARGRWRACWRRRGLEVTAIDPAAASLDVARRKPSSERVRWVRGECAALPFMQVDLVTMTGNVAQVFLTDEEWDAVLRAIHAALKPGGRLVFEARDPAKQAWRGWTRVQTHRRVDLPHAGAVEVWTDLIDDTPPLVAFRQHFTFAVDGASFASDSTLRFRDGMTSRSPWRGRGLSSRASGVPPTDLGCNLCSWRGASCTRRRTRLRNGPPALPRITA